jgi:hemerythrin-like domain-containing protein
MLLKIGQPLDHGFDQPLGLLSDCHRRIEHFLGVLMAILRDADGGALSASQQTELETALTYFATAAPRHTADEEESLFPKLRRLSGPDANRVMAIITRLHDDHHSVGDHHVSVDWLVRKWIADRHLLPDDARELGERLVALQGIYQEHIAIEDRELFPAAGRLLSSDDLRAIGREMAARRSERRY